MAAAVKLFHAATVEHFGLPGFSGQGTIRIAIGLPGSYVRARSFP
jgi:hypothetical protein